MCLSSEQSRGVKPSARAMRMVGAGSPSWHGAWLSAAVPYCAELRAPCALQSGTRASPCSVLKDAMDMALEKNKYREFSLLNVLLVG